MIRELGEVIAVDGHSVTIQTQLKSGCSGCQQQNHCGAGLLAKAFPDRRGVFDVWLENPPTVGAQVELLMPEKAMMQFSVLMYLLPIFALFAGAMIGSWLVPAHELVTIGLAAVAFAMSFYGLRRYLRARDARVRTLLQVHLISPQ
ncbi:MAG: SoxR reducing system RseC family protein [Aliidiomarina sp.]|uniref:SoxR reducing system RseC family protein n=1 Tax=Aliidiomarina sp. TaxID=1872439 RepID=UPI0025BD081A|nr:SoxR reducing system RseC family protein [Aliidiomarina sp.]MCH8501753.1 SoxR reducing system RseC family protein [Aliidiomarina sp.]